MVNNKADDKLYTIIGAIVIVVVVLIVIGIFGAISGNDDSEELKYKGVQDRTEENVDEWRYDGRRSSDGLDWEFIDRAREAFETGK